ncbi:MAG: hypothetical protein LBV79_07190, partial [Candidatus Adiutrix sp.]|nr:hypothetical protein [Candidatus Adiutrix sp.]
MKIIIHISALALALLIAGAADLRAQNAYIPQNAYVFGPGNLTVAMVRDELERRLALNPRNEASVWNAGYDFYRNAPHNQTTASIIMQ